MGNRGCQRGLCLEEKKNEHSSNSTKPFFSPPLQNNHYTGTAFKTYVAIIYPLDHLTVHSFYLMSLDIPLHL